jgi:uncharacterized SAM-binding protein YcdF (DUF218 family)
MSYWLKKFIGFWLMPLPLCLAAVVAGLVLLQLRRRVRLGRALVITGLAVLILLSNKFVSQWLIRPLETRYPALPEFVAGQPPPAPLAACRYVVVLGGGNGHSPGFAANNLLSSSSLARIIEAVRILRVLPDAQLIVSGPGNGRDATHAVVLGRTAEAFGISPDRILYIDQANDTEDESRAVARLVHGEPLAVVTSAWHMPRSVALFHAVGLNPLPCPTDYRSHADEDFYFHDLLWEVGSLERSSLAIRERIGFLWIWLRGKT